MPAGGEGRIEVGLTAAAKAEKMSKTVTVYTNDKSNPKLYLKVIATVTLQGQ
ncbi:MAG: DUF1573 domain-containing protein [Spirochaetes bacterium]|nr:MAG: DUF1573 domain-containing protein [Spirochaetota bacterium]